MRPPPAAVRDQGAAQHVRAHRERSKSSCSSMRPRNAWGRAAFLNAPAQRMGSGNHVIPVIEALVAGDVRRDDVVSARRRVLHRVGASEVDNYSTRLTHTLEELAFLHAHEIFHRIGVSPVRPAGLPFLTHARRTSLRA